MSQRSRAASVDTPRLFEWGLRAARTISGGIGIFYLRCLSEGEFVEFSRNTLDRLAAMEAFLRVVDAGSFSAAARQLRVHAHAECQRRGSEGINDFRQRRRFRRPVRC